LQPPTTTYATALPRPGTRCGGRLLPREPPFRRPRWPPPPSILTQYEPFYGTSGWGCWPWTAIGPLEVFTGSVARPGGWGAVARVWELGLTGLLPCVHHPGAVLGGGGCCLGGGAPDGGPGPDDLGGELDGAVRRTGRGGAPSMMPMDGVPSWKPGTRHGGLRHDPECHVALF